MRKSLIAILLAAAGLHGMLHGQATANTSAVGAKYIDFWPGGVGASGDACTAGHKFGSSTSGTNWLLCDSTGHLVVIATGAGTSPPFSDSGNVFKNSSDPTKLVKVDLSALTTGTTYTWSFPSLAAGTTATFAAIDNAATWTKTQTMRDILPGTSNTYRLGTSSAIWDQIHVNAATLYGSTFTFNGHTITDPGVSLTMAGKNVAQTFSNTQTFSSAIAAAAGVSSGGGYLFTSSQNIGSTGTPASSAYSTNVNTENVVIARPSTSFGTHWQFVNNLGDLRFLDEAGTIRLVYDPSGFLETENIIPIADNTSVNGNGSFRWADTRSVKINNKTAPLSGFLDSTIGTKLSCTSTGQMSSGTVTITTDAAQCGTAITTVDFMSSCVMRGTNDYCYMTGNPSGNTFTVAAGSGSGSAFFDFTAIGH